MQNIICEIFKFFVNEQEKVFLIFGVFFVIGLWAYIESWFLKLTNGK